METLMRGASMTYPAPRHRIGLGSGFLEKKNISYGNGCSSVFNRFRKAVIVAAKQKNKSKKDDTHTFIPKPDEATGPFPEAVLLKERKVQEDGRLQPEFADAEEEELFEFLNLQLESDLKVERMRHYEVVYLIHEKYAADVGSVNEKVQEFLGEKKGKIWRLGDWGMRRLAYKIQKAKNAHYILMNFELEAKWINDFKSMLDEDERVIRHLVIKRDEAITEDCPPPPEFHSLRSGMHDYGEDDDLDYDDTYDYEDEEENYDDHLKDGVIVVGSKEDDVDVDVDNDDDDDDDDDSSRDRNNISASATSTRRKNMIAEKINR